MRTGAGHSGSWNLPYADRGGGRALHETLLEGLEAQRVLLNVHPESRAASAAYRAWGYRKAGGTRPGQDFPPRPN
ncbi:hypothetical protein FHX79_113107 [Streptomyces cavourensis]|nr:hypothetical protein FHX79_113107 [Streptomyces cavourensis]GGU50614.1 hypothetical protein GCM10010498_04210 [Streptomyces cavourensis]